MLYLEAVAQGKEEEFMTETPIPIAMSTSISS
jgi:hypothetical protein